MGTLEGGKSLVKYIVLPGHVLLRRREKNDEEGEVRERVEVCATVWPIRFLLHSFSCHVAVHLVVHMPFLPYAMREAPRQELVTCTCREVWEWNRDFCFIIFVCVHFFILFGIPSSIILLCASQIYNIHLHTQAYLLIDFPPPSHTQQHLHPPSPNK